MTNILKPIPEPFPSDIAAILEKYPTVDGYLLKLFRTFANSLRFLTKAVPNLLDADSPLPMRQREIVILRVTANNKCEYEWGVHVTAFSAHVKLSDEQVAATYLHDDAASCWNAEEALLVKSLMSYVRPERSQKRPFQNFRAIGQKSSSLKFWRLPARIIR